MSSTVEPLQSRIIRPSPNEQTALLEKRRKEKRRQRLLEVREQEKEFARHVRENVRRRREEEQKLLEKHLKDCAEKEHQAELTRLEEELRKHYLSTGQGQRDAAEIGQEEERLQEMRLVLASQQRLLAKKRQQAAMKELAENNLRSNGPVGKLASKRAHALAVEKERAKKMASKPHKQSQTLIMELEPHLRDYLSTRRVRGVECFASTYFHLPDNLVDREDTPDISQPDASQAALQVNMAEKERHQHLSAVHEEQKEKARLRHKHALARVKLEKDKENVLRDLSLLVREDRAQRQRNLQNIPNNVFQPVQDRLQREEVEQCELEHAFEKILTGPGSKGAAVMTTKIILSNPSTPTKPHPPILSEPLPNLSQPIPLSPPSLPAPLVPITPQPHPELVTPSSTPPPHYLKEHSPLQELDKSALIVPCGHQEEVELSIRHITATNASSASQITTSSQEAGSSVNENTISTEDTHNELAAPNSSGSSTSMESSKTSESASGVSRLVGLIRSQQQAWQKRLSSRQPYTERPHPLSQHAPPLSLSISTVSSSTDQMPPDTDSNFPQNDAKYSRTVSTIIANSGGTATSSLNTGVSQPSSTCLSGRQETPSAVSTTTELSFSPLVEVSSRAANEGTGLDPAETGTEPVSYQSQATTSSFVPSSIDSTSHPSYLYSPYYYYYHYYPWVQQGSVQGLSGYSHTPHQLVGGSSLPQVNSSEVINQGGAQHMVDPIGASEGVRSNMSSLATESPFMMAGNGSDFDHNSELGNDRVYRFESPGLSDPASNVHSQLNGDDNFSSTALSGTPSPSFSPADGTESPETITSVSSLPANSTQTSNPTNEGLDSTVDDSAAETESVSILNECSKSGLEQEESEGVTLERREFIQNLLSSLNIEGSPPSEPELRTADPGTEPAMISSSSSNNSSLLSSQNRSLSNFEDYTPTNNRASPLLSSGNMAAAVATMPLPLELSSTSSDNASYRDLDTGKKVSPIFSPPSVSEQHEAVPDSQTQVPDNDRPDKPLSLQEAFLLKKKSFVQRSRDRMSQLESRAREREAAIQESQAKEREAALLLASSPPAPSKQRHVSFFSPVAKADDDQVKKYSGPPPARLLSRTKEKISLKEMHERNIRLYNQLPEVKQKKQEVKRKEDYAKNRERAKNYVQNLRLKVKTKKS